MLVGAAQSLHWQVFSLGTVTASAEPEPSSHYNAMVWAQWVISSLRLWVRSRSKLVAARPLPGLPLGPGHPTLRYSDLQGFPQAALKKIESGST